MSMTVQEAAEQLAKLDGVIAIATVDYTSGMTLSTHNVQPFDIELAAATATEVIRAKIRAMEQLDPNQRVEEFVAQTTKELHLAVLFSDPRYAGIFSYLILDRSKANLALARRRLHDVAEAGVEI